MPENQSQPRTEGLDNPQGGPQVSPQPDEPRSFDRPSDTEAAHAPEEGGAVRDPRLQTNEARAKSADPNHGSLDGHEPRDPRQDTRPSPSGGHRGEA